MGNSVKLTWHTEKRKLGDLIEWDKNPRQLKDHDAEHLKKSLDTFGVADPLIINTDNKIIGGHMRRRIMLKSGYKPDDLVDVRVPERELTEREAEELAIRLNKNTGDWDFDALANNFELDDLLDWGFDKQELDLDLWAGEPPEDVEPQIDKAEELREKWQVQTGQLWQLGEHRLVCGDCTDKAVVERVMGGETAAITFTSPPYNAGVSAELSGNTHIGDNLYGKEYDDNKSQADYFDLLKKFTELSMAVSQYSFVNIQFLSGNKVAFVDYLTAFRNKLADIAIWDKVNAAPQQAQRVMDSRFEFVLVFSESATRAIGTREFRGMVHNVYSGKPQRNNKYSSVHAATFPIDFPEHFINTFTNETELIFEPFIGTGTTLIACERLNRKCRAVEISPAYVAVAIQRWVDVTGGTPELVEPVMQVEAD